MKYTTVLQNISPEDRNCFSFIDKGTPTRRKLIFTHFSSPEDFQKRSERAIKNEHTRLIFSTRNIDFGVLVLASSFDGRGNLEEKRLKQQINFFMTKKDYLLYPSSFRNGSVLLCWRCC